MPLQPGTYAIGALVRFHIDGDELRLGEMSVSLDNLPRISSWSAPVEWCQTASSRPILRALHQRRHRLGRVAGLDEVVGHGNLRWELRILDFGLRIFKSKIPNPKSKMQNAINLLRSSPTTDTPPAFP